MKRKIDFGNIEKWQKSSTAKSKRQSKKEQIREAYINGATVEVIPAKAEIETEIKKI